MKKIAFLFLLTLIFSCEETNKNRTISGAVFGTSYAVIYNGDDNYQKQFDSLFVAINNSMSTYQKDSDISKINRNEAVKVDAHFKTVLKVAKEVYRATQGAFDPSIGAVVNAWDFGPDKNVETLDSLKIKSLMKTVGLNRVGLVANQVKKPYNVKLDFNAIAKGYGVDVIGQFLESKGVANYLVEIGGELRVRGLNVEKKSAWKVGIQNPNVDDSNPYIDTIELKDKAMATSGTYRKFKTDENGNRYAHIINTKTGYPSKTNILSVSVIADDCMVADAYATAIQSMKMNAIKDLLNKKQELQVFLIFENANKELEKLSFNGFLN